jgi:hypothetical protein
VNWPLHSSPVENDMVKARLSGILGSILAVIFLAGLGFVIVSMVMKR